MPYSGKVIGFQPVSGVVPYEIVGHAWMTEAELSFSVVECGTKSPHLAVSGDGGRSYKGNFGYQNSPPYQELDPQCHFNLQRINSKEAFLARLGDEGTRARRTDRLPAVLREVEGAPENASFFFGRYWCDRPHDREGLMAVMLVEHPDQDEPASTAVEMLDTRACLFAALREMDREAAPLKMDPAEWNDYPGGRLPTGLCYYHGHEAQQCSSRDDTERAWCRRLQHLLPERYGVQAASTETRYPDSRDLCDLVLKLPESLWLEVKGAWTAIYQYFPLDKNKAYRKHLVHPVEGLVADFSKVSRLTSPHASQVGVLLIGFDVEGLPGYAIKESDIEQVRQLARVQEDGWQEDRDDWTSAHQNAIPGRRCENVRVRCWLWRRHVKPRA